ncbi:hypothetical protein AMS68_006094 [Peltaster fructicola]|uniref:Ubiquitin carboxyl-terminal hydrolase n=1 Tax=Peltaster fructicola TaxID=286661 RepID=A0A6H0Y0P6_9PEZI|nr:hypothetical protein AMS68_006094 [Peltaster fructicola]
MTPTSTSSDAPKLMKKASDTKGSTHTTYGCQHVKGLLHSARQQAIDGYTRVLSTINRANNVSDNIHKTKEGTAVTAKATYLCLQCPQVNSTGTRHRDEHSFAIESNNGYLLCHDCHDIVYDPTLEDIRLSTTSNSRKRKLSAITFEPGEKRLVATNTSSNSCAATGLRGIYNMGQTCFMSVILQSLVHNPFLRAFYLNEGHRSSECEREACVSCAMDDIFTDFYGYEKHEGYGAVHMLQGCWKGGGGLAGYSQQDAHEYLGSILNGLHTANIDEDDDSVSATRDAKDCDCVIHQTFGGTYRSTVTCKVCKNTNTTYDPFTDLSLDIRNTTTSSKKKKLGLANGTSSTKESLPMDLTECLDRFTSPELLSADNYTCRKCDKGQEAEKRMRLHNLPPVLPIHLKRSHSKSSSQSTKVETKVRFPFTFDISPYTTAQSPTKKSAKQVEDSAENNDKEKSAPRPEAIYWLSSVVVHKGKIDNGHYISYSRQGDEWFRFDDSMVVKVDDKEVLGAEAYMLFYVIQDLDACA